MNVVTSSPTKVTMSIDGLHASLVYVDETTPTYVLNAVLRGMVRWEVILDFRTEIERYWENLINITRTQDLPGLDILFTSFPTPTHLYEVAIFTFRNILTGSEPDGLENVFALCSLSYVASICSQRTGKPDVDNIFRDIDIWRDSVGNPQHRQLFDKLKQRLWEDNTASSLQTEQFLHPASLIDSQDYMAPQGATMHGISLFGDLADPFWGAIFEVPGSLQGPTSNFQVAGTEGTRPTVSDTPELQLRSGDLRQSAAMNILTSFIVNCGDLFDILGGHGVTAKGPHSDVSLEVKNFTQALRRHDCFGDPSARGILTIVDRFVDLKYFQSIDEVQDYIMIVGKEMLPSGQIFAKVCKSVYSTGMAKIPSVKHRQIADRPQDFKLKKIPCHHCGEKFTRKTNMRRHIARKHANARVYDAC